MPALRTAVPLLLALATAASAAQGDMAAWERAQEVKRREADTARWQSAKPHDWSSVASERLPRPQEDSAGPAQQRSAYALSDGEVSAFDERWRRMAAENEEAGREARRAKAAEDARAHQKYEMMVRTEEACDIVGSANPSAAQLAGAATLLREGAAAGYAKAQRELANMLVRGYGVEPDPIAGFRLMAAAAEQNDPWATHDLARFVFAGVPGRRDCLLAARLFRRAAAFGCTWSQTWIDAMPVGADGVRGCADDAAVAVWCTTLMANGDPDRQACLNLAELLLDGRGVAKDPARALTLYLSRAGTTDPLLAAWVAQRLELALDAVFTMEAPDMRAVEPTATRLAGEGSVIAKHRLGLIYLLQAGSMLARGEPLIREAAAAGNPAARDTLAALLADQPPASPLLASAWYARRAAAGDLDASYEVGRRFQQGDGQARNEAQAIMWLSGAAGRGHAQARMLLDGYVLRIDELVAVKDGVPGWLEVAAEGGNAVAMAACVRRYTAGGIPFPAEAAKWRLRLAESGDAAARAAIGEQFAAVPAEQLFQRVADQHATVFRWTRQAAEAGSPAAAVLLADYYDKGYGTDADPQQAARWRAGAVAAGDPAATIAGLEAEFSAWNSDAGQAVLLTFLTRARPLLANADATLVARAAEIMRRAYYMDELIPLVPDEAQQLARIIAADPAADAGTWHDLGELFDHHGPQAAAVDRPTAFTWYLKAAEAGRADDQVIIAQRLLAGDGCTADEPGALAWLAKASATNNATASHQLGGYHDRGEHGLPVDRKEGFRLMLIAADWGMSHELAVVVGHRYESGDGVAANADSALEWYARLAKYGDGPSSFEVGRCLEQGIGIAPDPARAIEYYRNAVEAGNEPAKKRLAELGVAPEQPRAPGSSED